MLSEVLGCCRCGGCRGEADRDRVRLGLPPPRRGEVGRDRVRRCCGDELCLLVEVLSRCAPCRRPCRRPTCRGHGGLGLRPPRRGEVDRDRVRLGAAWCCLRTPIAPSSVGPHPVDTQSLWLPSSHWFLLLSCLRVQPVVRATQMSPAASLPVRWLHYLLHRHQYTADVGVLRLPDALATRGSPDGPLPVRQLQQRAPVVLVTRVSPAGPLHSK